jgi:predicted metal-dependent TIM-barrel fold hydrolase
MRIYLLRCRTLIEADKALEEILARGVVVSTTCVVREIIAQRGSRKLLREQINLVQEQDLMVVCETFRPRQSDISRTIDVLTNHRELHIESNSVRASCIRFYREMECHRRKTAIERG